MSQSLVASRRGVLRAAAGAAAGLTGLAGCARRDATTQVMVVWSGEELDQFRAVLRRYKHPVSVISAGDDIEELLLARLRAGTHPDVAILPRLGAIAEYVANGWIVPALRPGKLGERFPGPWNKLLRFDGRLYGAWVKAAHKSLFWYRPSTFDGAAEPRDWADLIQLVRNLADRRPPAPLAIGAADGWVLTDWLENLLAVTTTPEEYRGLAGDRPAWDLAAGPLRMLADLWGIPGAFPDGGGRALLTQWEESVIQVVRSHRAAMLFQADFVSSVVGRFAPAGDEKPRTFRFPAVAGKQPLLVSGDAAVVLRDTEAAHALVEWLTSEEAWPAFAPWLAGGGYLTPNLTLPEDAYPDDDTRDLARQVRTAQDPRFDLSDQLTGPLQGADGKGLWKILQDFFAAVTGAYAPAPADIDKLVQDTVTRLATTAASGTEPGSFREPR